VTAQLPTRTEVGALLLWPRIAAAVAAVIAVTLVVIVAASRDAFLRRTSQFRLQEIELTGAVHTTRDDILRAIGLHQGSDLLGLDERRATADAARLPWVRRAIVKLRVPATLVVEVAEREPVALISDGADRTLWYVDDEGVIFQQLVAGDAADLPVLYGIDRRLLASLPTAPEAIASQAEAAGGPAPASEAASHAQAIFRRAVQLLSAMEASELARLFPVAEVHWSDERGFRVVSADDGAWLQFGQRDLQGRDDLLVAAVRVLQAVRARNERLQYALLDDPRRPDRAVVAATPLPGPVGGPAGAAPPQPAPAGTSPHGPARATDSTLGDAPEAPATTKEEQSHDAAR